MNYKSKVTEAHRTEILNVYKTQGVEGARSLCVSLGLHPRYYSALAHLRGVAKKKSKPLTAAQKAQMRAVAPMDDSHDPRWQWAISRGPVIAP